jgi:SAM-dependent methyltransferase
VKELLTNSCILCGQTKSGILFHFENSDVVKCLTCGLCFAVPIPTRADLGGKYGTEYFENSYSESLDSGTLRTVGESVFPRLEKYRSPGNLLDVGCGTGEYLAAAQEKGWRSYGVDVSPFAVRTANSRKGVRAYAGFLDETKFEKEFFDATIMIHSLEHQINPVDTLSSVYALLKPGGVILISVPNINSAVAHREGRNWQGFQPGIHFYFFGKDTLRATAMKAGFDIMELDAPQAIVSGRSVDRLIGERFSAIARKKLRRRLGRLPELIRRGAGRLSEGGDVVLVAKKKDR